MFSSLLSTTTTPYSVHFADRSPSSSQYLTAKMQYRTSHVRDSTLSNVKDDTSCMLSISPRYETDFILRICADFVCFQCIGSRFTNFMLFLIQNVNVFLGSMSPSISILLIRNGFFDFLTLCECYICPFIPLFYHFYHFIIFIICIMCHSALCLHSEDWSVLTVFCFQGRFHCALCAFVTSTRTQMPRTLSCCLLHIIHLYPLYFYRFGAFVCSVLMASTRKYRGFICRVPAGSGQSFHHDLATL